MRIALDYDNTYALDKPFWDQFIKQAHEAGHHVICITLRFPSAPIDDMPCRVFYTSHQAKKPFAASQNIAVDIWIDDTPELITDESYGPMSNFAHLP
jgi:hypothetical protein